MYEQKKVSESDDGIAHTSSVRQCYTLSRGSYIRGCWLILQPSATMLTQGQWRLFVTTTCATFTLKFG